jgi:2,3-bisphosphoglycerate-independent phosphoglycerate mutase
MSAPEVTDKLVEAIESGKYDLIVCNYANGDMVGHTGIMEAAIKAVETIDNALGRLEKAIAKMGGVMLVTADHGNVELMKDQETGEPYTAHTVGAVPVVLVNAPEGVEGVSNGRLIGLPQPEAMTGRSLLVAEPVKRAAAGE